VPRIVLTTNVSAPVRECFNLSLSVEAHTASMASSGERVVAGTTSGILSLGETVTWKARHFGLPFTMTSQVTEYDAPRRFVDEQVTGPFGRWWHEHTFEEVRGGTVMTDIVEFASPLGPLGQLVDSMILTRYMTQLLMERNRWLTVAVS
jgi:ligand-binding SRPBCC domain-containing protein